MTLSADLESRFVPVKRSGASLQNIRGHVAISKRGSRHEGCLPTGLEDFHAKYAQAVANWTANANSTLGLSALLAM